MKILRVISSMNPTAGGPCQGIRNIVPYLQELGIENEVVCLDDPSERYGMQDPFLVIKLGKGKTGYQYQPQLVNWLLKNNSKYDVIIVHGLWQYPNFAVYKAIKKVKQNNVNVPKVIIMPHGMLDPYFQKAPDRKWKSLRNEMVWRITEKKAINQADAIFFTCEEELLLARTTFKEYLPKKEINVGYGIQKPPDKTSMQEKALNVLVPTLQNKYWLFLSRIHPKKGVDLLIEAYNNLCLDNRDLPDLVIAGPIDSDYAQEMISKAKRNPKIHFPGMLKGDAKWGAFYGCDAYLLPSHQENFGIALVEAMACQKPVLITKHINIWREIKHGNAGWILSELNVTTLHEQLIKIANLSEIELMDIGIKSHRTFEDKFSVENRAIIFAQTLWSL